MLTNKVESKMIVKAEKTMPMREEGVGVALKHHFVLVHGLGGGSWCWYKIRCLMENSGYRVSCIDLKSAGIDQSHADSILSFDDYNKPLMDFMSALPENEQGVPDLSEYGDVYELGFGLGHDKPPTSALVKKEFQRKVIYPLCPHEEHLLEMKSVNRKYCCGVQDSTLAGMLLRPGPVLALTSARFREGEEVEKVARVYIRTRHDKVVKPEQQEAMLKRWPSTTVYELDSDHSPFFSAPFLLFGLFLKAAASHVGFFDLSI
ncbi:hypothetical protein Fmac_007437 [Flemingia macrophylla]|uniref:AB hydrolase-1 domain-containing protein n=1 Tax=Flemingia macrophylla TaxID=520843 RepID=A0ABD1MVE5_9FABA